MANFARHFLRIGFRQIDEFSAAEEWRCAGEVELIGDHHPGAGRKAPVRDTGGVGQDQPLDSGRGQDSDAGRDLRAPDGPRKDERGPERK